MIIYIKTRQYNKILRIKGQQPKLNLNLTKIAINNINKMRSLTTCSFLNNYGDCPQSIDSPIQIKLINMLGLKNYVIENFIFRRKPTKYIIRNKQQQPTLYLLNPPTSTSTSTPTSSPFPQLTPYSPPPTHTLFTTILQTSSHSIPICCFIPKIKQNNICIIYSHGNGSDMSDSISFIERLTMFINVQFIVYDYTGYGESRVGDVGEDVICGDLEIVLAWVVGKRGKRLEDVVLWGFSLGTFPTIHTSSKHPQLPTLILQCPIASISCLFHKQLHPEMHFKQDHFANIDYLHKIKAKTLIIHSNGDQIIPIQHAKLIYDKLRNCHGQDMVEFVEVGKIRHNGLHKYIVSVVGNQLQKEVLRFVDQAIKRVTKNRKILKNNIISCTNSKIQPLNSPTNHATHNRNTIKTQPSLHTIQQQFPSTITQPNSTTSLQPHSPSNLQIQSQPKSQSQSQPQPKNIKQLHNLYMTILYADIEQISDDMHELVVDEEEEKEKVKVKSKGNKVENQKNGKGGWKIKERIFDGRGYNCFCFTEEGEKKGAAVKKKGC